MGSIARQEERWTGVPTKKPAGLLAEYDVFNSIGEWMGSITVPHGDAGRSTVAKMVAALQMEEALKAAADWYAEYSDEVMDPAGDPGEPCGVNIASTLRDQLRAALETAKRLQP